VLRLIRSQLSAQSLQISTQSSMSPTFSQLSAHALQISAQALQTKACCGTPVSITAADDRQISAQAIISRKCSGSTWSPPASRQWFIASLKHVIEQAVQSSTQACLSAESFIAVSQDFSRQPQSCAKVAPALFQ
jgi:hypothetical protein